MERFIIVPSVKYFGGITVKKDTVLNEKTENGEVEQELKDLVLTTKIKKEHEYGGIKTIEETTLSQTLQEGTRLIWGEQEGYVVPPYKMVTVEEAIEELNMIKE